VGRNHQNGGILYSRLSDYYDTLFRWFTIPRQKALMKEMEIEPGSHIMDLGVGTGLSLHLYPRNCRVTGIDISPKMLTHARKRVVRKKLHHVDLVEMDAHELDKGFDSDTFDVIVASFVLTVVKDPVRVLRHMKTVGKPDCTMYIVNHSRSHQPALRKCEEFLEPICRKIGWNYAVDLEDVIEKAGLHVVSTRPCFPYDPWVIVQARNGRS
jgi:phosphatidylethanolamine/phosphatidyl-N-methylethanolamine N-methyltransferase